MKAQSFRFLWLSQAFANLGDVFYIVGLISVMYTASESAFYLALLPFINTFGRFLSGFISPLLFDKFRLKTLLAGSQICKTAILLALATWVHLKSDSSIAGMLVFILVIAFLDGWAMPASRAMIPRLVSKNDIVKANSFIAAVNQTIQLGGWALGGILVAVLGGQNVIWLTFILFVVSSVMVVNIIDQTSFHSKEFNKKPGEVMKKGWRTIWRTPTFRSLHVVIFIEAVANVVWIAAILYVFVTEILLKSEAWWGYINTTFFAGLLVGGLLCSKYANMIELHLRKIMIFTSIGVSVVTLLFGFNSMAWLALALSVAIGIFEQVKSITIETYIQKEANHEELPNIYGAQGALISLTFGLSSVILGAITDLFGVQYAFFLSGLLLAVAAVYITASKNRFPESYQIKGNK